METEVKNMVIISPATGKIVDIERDKERTTICIFLGPLDNHTQYAPVDGEVVDITKIKGSDMPAFLHAGKKNNAIETQIKTEYGEMRVRQMTGFFFRRIINNLKKGDLIKQKQEIGHIVLGSRVEIEIPEKFIILVKKSDRIEGGKTAIAEFKKEMGTIS
ncbi:phosphatidylserine decarboxylase [Candidatus Micrarchaeota archaeon]|nr:phosphatidylserine decarboxylase [Candidatus Micrarchaeota archaeon]MBU1166709.1 phosphatidylserine decarboxylase [Candidatus Micrarchaeota archaeon]MBU1886774.1 phosphatidylserine decarboxylase [Candidatus Micrarchaeota archaeon]